MNVIIKDGLELSPDELLQINATKARQWHIPPFEKESKAGTIFFLLRDDTDRIFAQGELIEINGIIFDNQTFNIFGIGGIVANEWGKGYGSQVMRALQDYITEQKKSGVGFTNKPGFYEKCGFKIDDNSKKRFIHYVNGEKIINNNDEVLLYIDGEDRFMEKVLSSDSEEVLLPIDPDW